MLRRVRLVREEVSAETALEPAINSQVLNFGDLVLDLSRREVRLNSEPLSLKPKEYELLLFFAQHQGQVLSREFILEKLWEWDYIGDSRTVDVHVRWLREKIERDPGAPTRLLTIRGAGYRFEG
jgi:DNA-binding response OmpR family regulator